MHSKTHHKIIIADARRMCELDKESVHLVVTSPPYWQLKDYGNQSQIGFDNSYEDYINNLNLVWSECYRVLHPGCRLCINIGDQFARSVYYGRYKIIPIRTEIIRFCETIGFDYLGAIIWQKVTTCNTTGGATVMGSYPYPRNGVVKIDYEFILLFKKLGNPPKISKTAKERSKLSNDEWNTYFNGHWNFPGERQDKHLAMFPEELPKRLIRMFSFEGETVLDPFLGSGTTSLAAMKLHRSSCGYEINSAFLPVIRQKLGDGSKLWEASFLDICERPVIQQDFTADLERLPYLFKDPVIFDKKVDPRKLGFGSKITHCSKSQKQNAHFVKNVVDPETILLDNGLQVKLLGVKRHPATSEQAVRFLQQKLHKQKVTLQFDVVEPDAGSCLPCYVYLENKTFINAHLIRTGLVDIDTTSNYRLKQKFLTMQKDASWQKNGF